MSEAAAPDAVATAGREHGWRWFVLGLVLMVVITSAPAWPASLALFAGVVRLLLPIEQFALLVLVSIACCAVVGWWAGGRLFLACVWLAVAGYVLWKVPLPMSGYGVFLRSWAVTLGAAFGIICLISPGKVFLGRALAAVALAAAVTTAGFSVRASRSGRSDTFGAPARMFAREYEQRVAETLASWRTRASSDAWKVFSRRFPGASDRARDLESLVVALGEPRAASPAVGGSRPGRMVGLIPALLGLESLLALALGWAAYHRLARVRIGPPIGALKDLKFNDQWVWGLVVGITILLLPTLIEWRAAGLNLVCFLGTLYALRGAGVLTWWIPDRAAIWLLLALVILVSVLGPLWVLVATLLVTFALGLGDTWQDFRTGSPASWPWSS